MSPGDVRPSDQAAASPTEHETGTVNFSEQVHRYRGKGLPNGMSVDVEDYFQVSAFENAISRDDWANMPVRLPRNIEKILLLFEQENAPPGFCQRGSGREAV